LYKFSWLFHGLHQSLNCVNWLRDDHWVKYYDCKWVNQVTLHRWQLDTAKNKKIKNFWLESQRTTKDWTGERYIMEALFTYTVSPNCFETAVTRRRLFLRSSSS
jgi:hypothetical protein